MSGPGQTGVLAPDDGSLGPLLRVSDDRLAPGQGYGAHEHAAVDVVAVVLAGSLRHGWGDGALMAAGDVGVLRAGTGLIHDESAEDGRRRDGRPVADDVLDAHECVLDRVLSLLRQVERRR